MLMPIDKVKKRETDGIEKDRSTKSLIKCNEKQYQLKAIKTQRTIRAREIFVLFVERLGTECRS